jgi:hypothetical protein
MKNNIKIFILIILFIFIIALSIIFFLNTKKNSDSFSTSEYIAPNVAISNETIESAKTTDSKSIYDLLDSNKIIININENSITPTGLSYTIFNQNNISCPYFNTYSIEKKDDDTWNLVTQYIDSGELISDYISSNSSKEIEINWNNIYGELSTGIYRLKLISTLDTSGEYQYVYLEFNIE